MARPSFIPRIQSFADKIGKKLDPFFPVRVFALSLAALMLVLVVSLGVMIALYAKVEVPAKPTGKVVATITVQPPSPIESTLVTPPKKTDAQISADHPPVTTPEPIKTEETPSAITSPTPALIPVEDSVAGLSEETPFGALPIVRHEDGLKAFTAYKAPFTLTPDTKGVIALVMVDFGLSEKMSKSALETLPFPITYVTSSYVDNLQSKIAAARTKGAEIWMHLPMQGKGNFAENDAGPAALLSGLNIKQNTDRLYTNLGRATGYAGIAITVDPDFADNSPELPPLLQNVTNRGLGIAQMDPDDKTIGLAAAQANAPFIQSTQWIDRIETKDAIWAALNTVQSRSIEKGYAVAAFHPSRLVFSVIADWQKTLATQHIQLAPLTYAAHQSAMTINQIQGEKPPEKPPEKQ